MRVRETLRSPCSFVFAARAYQRVRLSPQVILEYRIQTKYEKIGRRFPTHATRRRDSVLRATLNHRHRSELSLSSPLRHWLLKAHFHFVSTLSHLIPFSFIVVWVSVTDAASQES